MTPITSSTGTEVVPVNGGGGMNDADGAGRIIPDIIPAPVAVPHTPQNFVVALTAAPQCAQVVRSGGEATGGREGGADTTGAPQIPQNFSIPLTGLPQDLHKGREPGGGVTSVVMTLGITGGTGTASATFARHLLQNLSPGLITYPHDRHNRVPVGFDAGVPVNDGI